MNNRKCHVACLTIYPPTASTETLTKSEASRENWKLCEGGSAHLPNKETRKVLDKIKEGKNLLKGNEADKITKKFGL